MMKISIHKVSDYKTRELIREAAGFFMKELIPSRILRDIKLGVVLTTHLSKQGIWGCCDARTPKNFIIELHPHKWVTKKLLKTLAHECIHVKQYALGEMQEIDYNTTMWKSRKIDNEKLSYHQHPWEIEAFSNEELLYMLWKNYKHDDF